jgi:hypothetical protein
VIIIPIKDVCFSHRENRYDVKQGKFNWTDKIEIWDWDHCNVGLVRTFDNKLLVVVRSKTNKNSRYMGNKPVELRYMLGFEVNKVSGPRSEIYTAWENRKSHERAGPEERWVVQLNDDYWIWEWAKEEIDIDSSSISRFYQLIKEEISNPSIKSDNRFDVELESPADKIIPVIYQPAVDSLDNFVREVHCAPSEKADGSFEVEVTIIFNNEVLRKHAYGGIVNKLYELFRRLRHGRILDIESFKILVRKDVDDNKFIFENIYSDDFQLEHDSIHGDKIPPPPRRHRIKYYFIDHNHPVVFINTSNHAMAEHDTNHRIWKWEYVPGLDNAPVKCDNMTRKEIEKQFKPILHF